MKINEYVIPKDAIVIPMLRSCHLDPSEFSDPNVFRPERWISDGKVNSKHPAFMPFSVGKTALNSIMSQILHGWFPTKIKMYDIQGP